MGGGLAISSSVFSIPRTSAIETLTMAFISSYARADTPSNNAVNGSSVSRRMFRDL